MNTNIDFANALSRTPDLPQRQDSLTDQIRDLARLATKFGLYDAGDWLEKSYISQVGLQKYFKTLLGGDMTSVCVKDSGCDCEED